METRTCQNCKIEFVIEKEDFKFYEKIKVPPPTFCPECRLIRRLSWRNERSLFHAKCDNCEKKIFSSYASDSISPVFCKDCWFSDAWDPLAYGKEYDFSKPFFLQFKELFNKVPKLNLFHINSKNSDYSNIIRDCKNVYLSYSIVEGEDIFYSKDIDHSRQIFDSLTINDCEKSAFLVYCANDYNVIYSITVLDCFDSMFLYDCRNCSNCFMSANLRNQQYVFREKKYPKEEYFNLISKINTGSYEEFEKLIVEFEKMKERAIHRYSQVGKLVINSTGDAISNTRNSRECFNAYDMENTKWTYRCFALKDAYDSNYGGLNSELVYEFISGGKEQSKAFFTVAAMNFLRDTYYTGWSNGFKLFGCFGVRNGKYCILNKQYTEEQYEELVPKIIKHMVEIPFEGEDGRKYYFGDFFPFELSFYAYNESAAQEIFPLTFEQIKNKGYIYRESEKKKYEITKRTEDLPDNIFEITDNILKEIIECEHKGRCLHQCTTAFKIHPEELSFYRNFKLPIPRSCPNCRFYKRLEYRNPWKLWHRKCMKEGCQNEFETSYAPDRPEIVYCERCYQQEVY
ncbi:MAG: hypothetical protein NT161_03110 [Candidatus Nomurabacteria bacterium]|nr:hypothetical protein [Candidatus Nomurabacteria bacterium]